MKTQGTQQSGGKPRPNQTDSNLLLGLNLPHKTIIGILLVVALLAFELFNFDTTRYALNSLLGDVRFAGVGWATILAIAFCAIDFAGLARLFTPERGQDEPTAVWYLMGAWLLGATMNAIMTWWAISLTLLTHDLGNEVLSREQLLRWVPFFVATLVWLTRILFIGAISVAGEHLFATTQRPISKLPAGERTSPRERPSPSLPARRTPAVERPFQPNPAPMRARPHHSQPENGQPNARTPLNRPNPGRRDGLQAPGRSQSRPRR